MMSRTEHCIRLILAHHLAWSKLRPYIRDLLARGCVQIPQHAGVANTTQEEVPPEELQSPNARKLIQSVNFESPFVIDVTSALLCDTEVCPVMEEAPAAARFLHLHLTSRTP